MGIINRKNKKGFIFTLDAILALTLLVAGIIIISKITYVETSPNKQVAYVSEDVINVLANTKVSESNNPLVVELINNGTITRLNITIIEQIGYFWVENETELALSLAQNVTDGILPNNMDLKLMAEDTEIYSSEGSSGSIAKELVSYKSLISGIALDRPIRGTSSRIHLTDVDEQLRTDYIYFGGFEGEGNITKFIELPSFLEIQEVSLEVNAIDDFNIFINDNFCDTIVINNTNSSSYSSEYFDISGCSGMLNSSNNNYFMLDFVNNDINSSYIGGGFIKIKYKTNELYSRELTTHKEYFPGIKGIINLYSSIFVPGELSSMDVYLHYEINNSNTSNVLFLNIGNDTIYQDLGSTGEVTFTLSDVNISTILNYSLINSTTLPIRFGYTNLSYVEINEGREGRGDAVLVTDESGSMDWRMDNNNMGTERTCTDPSLDSTSTSRMSVAKCVNKDFVRNVLENVTGNRIGLVSYAYYANDVTSLTDNITQLESDIDDYNPSGGTCISCGIYNATYLLLSEIMVQLNDDIWSYSTDYQFIDAPVNWTNISYDDSSWNSGSTIIGFGIGVDTEINTSFTYADLWDNTADNSTPIVDFTSGINSSANTFGALAGDDGWDWDTGVYDYSNGQVDGEVSGRLRLYSTYTRDTSAAYGIQINITDEIYSLISSGATVYVSFDYEWDGNNPYFESSDQVWIKGTWTSPTSGAHELGSNLDSGHSHSDSSFEIDTENNPDTDFSDSFLQEVSSWIEGPGFYYFDFGGKLDRSWRSETGYFYFDNVALSIRDSVGNIYLRNTFNVTDTDSYSDLMLYVYSDDSAEIYLNDVLVDIDIANHTASYWNREVLVNKSYLITGENVIAVKLNNNDSSSAMFDLELKTNSTDRQRAMLVMSDGEANRCHGPDDGTMDTNGWSGSCGSTSAKQEAIDFACYAHENYNISIYAVAFGAAADTSTLQSIADCDNSSHFYQSDNVTGLQQIYQDIADSMIEIFVEQEAQTISVDGNFTENTLYSDSYINLIYSSSATTLEYGEVPIFFEENIFTGSCSATVDIPTDVRVVDSKITSYSGPYWTTLLSVNSNNVFDLTNYGTDFTVLGDPYLVTIDPEVFVSGSNTLSISLGVNETITSQCSANNSFIYTGIINLLNISLPYSSVLPLGEGCYWNVEFEDDSFGNISVPADYIGNNSCNYTTSSVYYNSGDSYDVAMYNLLYYLDFDKDGKVFVNFESNDLLIDTKSVEEVPYLWGPSVIEVRVWQ